MEKNEISSHEVWVWNAFSENPKRWLTNKDVRTICGESKISNRTVRMHTLRLVGLGLLDQVELFPGHRYRLSDKADKRNVGYLQRLKQAAEIFASAEA